MSNVVPFPQEPGLMDCPKCGCCLFVLWEDGVGCANNQCKAKFDVETFYTSEVVYEPEPA